MDLELAVLIASSLPVLKIVYDTVRTYLSGRNATRVRIERDGEESVELDVSDAQDAERLVDELTRRGRDGNGDK